MRLKLEMILLFLLARAKEASTWQGVIVLAGGSGHFAADLDPKICVLLAGLAFGVVSILFPDAKPPKE